MLAVSAIARVTTVTAPKLNLKHKRLPSAVRKQVYVANRNKQALFVLSKNLKILKYAIRRGLPFDQFTNNGVKSIAV